MTSKSYKRKVYCVSRDMQKPLLVLLMFYIKSIGENVDFKVYYRMFVSV